MCAILKLLEKFCPYTPLKLELLTLFLVTQYSCHL